MTTPIWVLLVFLAFASGICAMGLGVVYLRHLRWKRRQGPRVQTYTQYAWLRERRRT